MINELDVGSQSEFLLRPHKCNTFSSSPVRFITVIKVVFAHTPAESLPSCPFLEPHRRPKPPRLCLVFEFFFFPFSARWSSADVDNQLPQIAHEKQIASFEHENDWAKGRQTHCDAFIKAVYTRCKIPAAGSTWEIALLSWQFIIDMLYLLNNRSVRNLSRQIQHVNYYNWVKLQWDLLTVLNLLQPSSSSGPSFDMWSWKQEMASLFWDIMSDWI